MISHKLLKEKILNLCKEKNISVNKLAVMSNLTQSTVNSIIQGESKNPQIKTLQKLANGFEMDFNDFLQYLFDNKNSQKE